MIKFYFQAFPVIILFFIHLILYKILMKKKIFFYNVLLQIHKLI